jgi:hypothetical protein
MAITGDMPFQAELLVRRMRTDKRVDYENDWKVSGLSTLKFLVSFFNPLEPSGYYMYHQP